MSSLSSNPQAIHPQASEETQGVPLPEIQLEAKEGEHHTYYISWKNFFFKIWWNLRRLFENPFKEQTKELRLLDQVEILLSEGEANGVADACERYIALHRIVENTKARRRLERWITRLTVFYLVTAALLLLFNSMQQWLSENGWLYIKMDETIVIALLTTTTVNILALGYILVRGLFHENEGKDIKKENPM